MGVIWALEWVVENVSSAEKTSPSPSPKIHLYTDCQAVVNLPQRRSKLETRSFKSQKTGSLLKNADLYRRFFSLMDQVSIKLFWLKGHTEKAGQSLYQRNFSYIDRHVRKTLREKIASLWVWRTFFGPSSGHRHPSSDQIDKVGKERYKINS